MNRNQCTQNEIYDLKKKQQRNNRNKNSVIVIS